MVAKSESRHSNFTARLNLGENKRGPNRVGEGRERHSTRHKSMAEGLGTSGHHCHPNPMDIRATYCPIFWFTELN